MAKKKKNLLAAIPQPRAHASAPQVEAACALFELALAFSFIRPKSFLTENSRPALFTGSFISFSQGTACLFACQNDPDGADKANGILMGDLALNVCCALAAKKHTLSAGALSALCERAETLFSYLSDDDALSLSLVFPVKTLPLPGRHRRDAGQADPRCLHFCARDALSVIDAHGAERSPEFLAFLRDAGADKILEPAGRAAAEALLIDETLNEIIPPRSVRRLAL